MHHKQHRKTKHAKLAEEHLEKVCRMLAEKDESLAQKARNAPVPKVEKRRASSGSGNNTPSKKRKAASSAGEGMGGLHSHCQRPYQGTVCPRSRDPIYIVAYFMK